MSPSHTHPTGEDRIIAENYGNGRSSDLQPSSALLIPKDFVNAKLMTSGLPGLLARFPFNHNPLLSE